MLDELRERISMSPNKAIKESFWQLDDDPFGVVDWVREHQKNALNYYNKLNTEKEKEKMNAKKCDRCGKLYIETNEPIKAYLCGRVTDHEKGTYIPEKIKEFNTFNIKIVLNSIDEVDMCPDCREKLKNFFESGADEAKE